MDKKMSFARRIVFATSAAVLASAPPALAAKGEIGTLTCKGGAGVGMIIGSKKTFDCHFKPVKGATETYEATVTKIGLDVGFTSAATIVWTVFSSTDIPGERPLTGEYVGANADASLGIGAGTKILVGGSKNTISLQPLSVQGQTGLNLAVGIADMNLR